MSIAIIRNLAKGGGNVDKDIVFVENSVAQVAFTNGISDSSNLAIYQVWSDKGGSPQSQVVHDYNTELNKSFKIKTGGKFTYNISGTASSRAVSGYNSSVSVTAKLVVNYKDGTSEEISILGNGTTPTFAKDGTAIIRIRLYGSTWQGTTYSSGGNYEYGRSGWTLSVSITAAKYIAAAS